MLKSRLIIWRALAVLGALLSVMPDVVWPIGYAMPANNDFNYTIFNSSNNENVDRNISNNINCNNATRESLVTNNNVNSTISPPLFNINNTNSSDHVIDNSSYSYKKSNSNSDNTDIKFSNSSLYISNNIRKNSNNSSNSSDIHNNKYNISQQINSNINRSLVRQSIISGNYTKRKRKKDFVFRLTSDRIRNLRTHRNIGSILNRSDYSKSDIKNNRDNNYMTSTAALITSAESSTLNSESSSIHPSAWETTTLTTSVETTDKSSISENRLSRTDRSINSNKKRNRLNNRVKLDRNERSANLSLSGPSTKIQLYIKNHFIQLLPDGTVNGTQDDLSDYTILQRTTVDVGQIKIRGVATCLYMCMDQCGAVYGSKQFNDDCVFNEWMEQHHYNTYSSTHNSNQRRMLYLGFNRHGAPRKLNIPATRKLGKLATYTKALPEPVTQERVESLIARTFGEYRIKHGLRQLCDAGKPLVELTAAVMREHPKCIITANANLGGGEVGVTISSGNRLSSSPTNRPNIGINNNNNNNRKKKRRCDTETSENCGKPKRQKCQNDADCAKRKRNKPKKTQRQQQQRQNGGGNGNSNGNGNRKNTNQRRANGRQNQNGGGGRSNLRTSTARYPTTTNRYNHGGHNYSDDDEGNGDDSFIGGGGSSTEQVDDGEDETSILPSIGGGHTQLIGSDDFFYDDEFDV